MSEDPQSGSAANVLLASQLVGAGFDAWLAATEALEAMTPEQRQKVYNAARSIAEQRLRQAMHSGKLEAVQEALEDLAQVAREQEDYGTAHQLYTAILYWERRSPGLGFPYTLTSAADVAAKLGEQRTASAYYREAMRRTRQTEFKPLIAHTLISYGIYLGAQGRLSSARAAFAESVLLRWQCKQAGEEFDNRSHLCAVFREFATAALQKRRSLPATQALAVAYTLAEEIGPPFNSDPYGLFEGLMVQARSQLSERAFTTAWERGKKMTVEQAYLSLLKGPPDTLLSDLAAT